MTLVPGPEVRERCEHDERGYRKREEERRRGCFPAEQEPVRESEHGGGEHEVERKEQEGVLRPELDRNPERRHGQKRHGDDSGVACERGPAEDRRDGSHRHEGDASGVAVEERDVLVSDE